MEQFLREVVVGPMIPFVGSLVSALFVVCESHMYFRSSLFSLHLLEGEKRRQEILLFVAIMNL